MTKPPATKNSVKLERLISLLTPKQKAVYDFILMHRAKYQTLPSCTEINVGMGYSSTRASHYIKECLIENGVLQKSHNNVGYIVTALRDEGLE